MIYLFLIHIVLTAYLHHTIWNNNDKTIKQTACEFPTVGCNDQKKLSIADDVAHEHLRLY